MEKVGTFNEIYQRHRDPTNYPECQRKRHTKMVDLWIIRGEYKHEWAHWWWSINGKMISHFHFNKTEAEHAKFH